MVCLQSEFLMATCQQEHHYLVTMVAVTLPMSKSCVMVNYKGYLRDDGCFLTVFHHIEIEVVEGT